MQTAGLARMMARANEFKEGDLQIGGTRDAVERAEAREALSGVRLEKLGPASLVEDEVSKALYSALDREIAGGLARLTVADLRAALLGPKGAAWAARHSPGLSSEAIAAAVKLMTNDELSALSLSLFNPFPGEGVAVGSRGHFGSRIQPNSPGDDEEEILLTIMEGLSYGCGDVLIGVNPASDDVDTIARLEELLRWVKERLSLPTRYCVLSDIVKQATARKHATVEVAFQSLAGTSAALSGMVGLDAGGVLELAREFPGLYFETGQGSEVASGTAAGVDMVTLESRTYGLARYLRGETGAWTITNDVSGFIGPEIFRTEAQLLRACLEDIVMAKLHGLPPGLDVCSTFHMGIAPEALRRLTALVVEKAAPAYLMAIAGNADPMLGLMTTSFREHPAFRKRTGRTVATPLLERLNELGVMLPGGGLAPDRPRADSLYAAYVKARGDTRSFETLRREGEKKLEELAARGFDLGYGCGPGFAPPPEIEDRMEAIFRNARAALYASIHEAVLRDATPGCIRVRTTAADREEYLSSPSVAERLRPEDAARVAALYTAPPEVLLVISDGLNANAINENLRSFLPPLKRMLVDSGISPGETDMVIENGRVRAGYHVGELTGARLVVHLIGERPGTGLDTMSAYLTYGYDEADRPVWSTSLEHSRTTAVCGISRGAKDPADAAAEVLRLAGRILEERRSGVRLSGDAPTMSL